MFSNSVYRTIAAGEDSYRSLPDDLSGLIKTSFLNIFTICENVAILNTAAVISVSVLLSIIVYAYTKKSDCSKKNRTVIVALCINIICNCAFVFKKISSYPGYYDNSFVDLAVKIAFTFSVALYAVTVIVIVFICVSKSKRLSLIFPLICIPVAVSPLAFVNPIGARCFFISQLLLTVFVASLFGYTIEEITVNINRRWIYCSLTAVTAVLAVVFVSAFLPVYKTEKIRNEFAQLQSANKENVIVVGKLPENVYIHTPNPHNDAWAESYKSFFNINVNAQLELMEGDEFAEYYEAYMERAK